MNSDHLKVLLEGPGSSTLFCEAATQLARATVPLEVVEAMRLGRITALQKPDGGVHGIVVRDVFRRLVARANAEQYGRADVAHIRSNMPCQRGHGRSASRTWSRR